MSRIVVCKKCGDTMPPDRKHTWCKACLRVYVSVSRANKMLSGVKHKPRRSTRKAGENHWNAKVSENTVKEVRLMRAGGMQLKRIAHYVGLSMGHISRICKGEAWGGGNV
jgi:hypothetical protein